MLQQAEVVRRYEGAPVETTIVSLDSPNDAWVASCPVKTFALGPNGRETDMQALLARMLRRYRYAPRLASWLKENARHYDVVVVHGQWNYSALACAYVLPRSGVPYFAFPHGMMDPWFKRAYPIKHLVKQLLWLVGEGRLGARAQGVFFTSEEERLRACGVFAGYRKYRSLVIGYGTSEPPLHSEAQGSAFRASVPALGDRKFLLFLSRIHPKKGCDLLIEGFADVARRRPDVDLVFAGPDRANWRRELEEKAAALGIGGRVHWPGMLTGAAKWGAFRSADAFVLPSHQENFGIVVAEALACGTPALITDKVNIWREVDASGGGFVAPDDADGVRELLLRWLELDESAKARMRSCARAAFTKHFDLTTTARKQIRILEAACSASHRVERGGQRGSVTSAADVHQMDAAR
jgi:glycosyltransferase involved in cell wall biosynthesis